MKIKNIAKYITVYFAVMFIILFILDSIPEFVNFYPSSTWSIMILFGAGGGFFVFFISVSIESIKREVRPLIRFTSLLLSSFFIREIYIWIRVPLKYNIYTELGIKLFFYILIVTLVAFSFSYLMEYGKQIDNRYIKNVVDKLIDFRDASSLLFSFLFSYFTFGREIFISVYPLPFHVDWLFIGLISLVIGVGYYQYLNDSTADLDFPSRDKEENIYSSKLGERIKIQDSFVNYSKKDDLVFYILDMLVYKSKFLSEEDALDILKPLIIYKEEPIPFYLIGRWKRRAIEERKRSRKIILNDLTDRIEDEIEKDKIKIV